MKSIMLAAAEIRAGDAEIVVAGGMENMNQGPYLIPKARFGYRLGNAEMVDATVHDGLWCSVEGCHMGTHAERVAIKDAVSRADQDQFALESHQKALAAITEGRFKDEIVPVPVRKGREEVMRSCSTPMKGLEPTRASRRSPD
jgi:acetyl-CoA C-acetyltransferase